MSKVELLHMDCMEYMKGCRHNEFDLAIVDPPYGIQRSGQAETKNKERNPKQNRKYFKDKAWDDSIPPAEYFQRLQIIAKNQIIWGGNYFVLHLNEGHKGWIYWDKGQDGLTMSDGELAYTSFDKPLRRYVMNRCRLNQEGAGTIHPTQKPIHLYSWLLTNYAKPTDRILDTHLGSGSSAIAAHYFGCDFVGMEIDEDYYNAACKRFEAETAQISLLEGI